MSRSFGLRVGFICGLLALPVAPALAGNTQGFLYGKVTTDSGSTYTGRIRWGGEEAFWGDIFNSVKSEESLEELVPKSARPRRREPITIFGITIGRHWEDSDVARVFKARFGDIDEIERRRGEEVVVTMKSGTEYRLDGGSNDIGAKILVWDPAIGEIELDWTKIETIEFQAPPAKLEVDGYRLRGTLKTAVGELRGYIQWDQDECLSTDKLDGDSPDGRLSLPMGSLRSIERRSRQAALVRLKDGREFTLEGTNDVNSDTNGIFIEEPRYGRLLVPWDAFERLDFAEPGDSGPGYDEFKAGKRLYGKAKDVEGHTYRGRIVYDLDEAETWEMLDGNQKDVEYAIPMGLIASVIPGAHDSVRVVLKSGEELELEDTADTGDGNAGVLVIDDQDHRTHIPWEDLERIDFDR